VRWLSAAKCSITSRSSRRESASAPSAEPSLRPTFNCPPSCRPDVSGRSIGSCCQKFCKKLWHRRHHMSQRRGVDTGVDNLRPTFGLVGAFFTTPQESTMRRPVAANCPQLTHTQTRVPRWADTPLSPMCTCPNTVAHISSKFLLRRRHLGTHRFTARHAPLPRAMSPRSISFQVEAESSTVVHRQPLRSWHASGRRGARHRETAG
jgi:hypothetical protein